MDGVKKFFPGENLKTESESFKPQDVIFEFEKENKVQKVDFNLLEQSVRRDSGLAGIRQIPKQYWGLYSAIIIMLNQAGINYDNSKPIWVQNNSSKAYLTDTEREQGYSQKRAPINRWRFDKVISTIQLPAIVDGNINSTSIARNAAIGLTLNKEGLSVAFGMNVHACTNFNVMGGTIMRSYGSRNAGREALPWDVMKFRLQDWIGSLNQIWKVQNDIMHEMQSYQLESPKVIEEVVGDLYLNAIKQAYFKGNETPFNTYEMSEFCQEIIRQHKESDTLGTVWDLYNWGTYMMKPGKVDIGEIAENSNRWSSHLINRFDLQVPVNIIEETQITE